MRWSSLNSLLFVLLASVAFDGILARPLPDTVGLYPRAPTDPPKGKKAASSPPPQTPIAKRLRRSAPQTPSRIPVSVKKPRAQSPQPATGGASRRYNLRARPRTHNVPNTVAQGKKTALLPTKIPRPKGQVKAGDLKTSNYRAKAIKQGLVYSPGQGKVVQRKLTTSELPKYHADHVVEAQTVAGVLEKHPPLNTPQAKGVTEMLNGNKNVVLTEKPFNIHKGVETGRAIREEPSHITPGTQRYMTNVAGRAGEVSKELDKAAGTGTAIQDAQKKIAHRTRTKSPS